MKTFDDWFAEMKSNDLWWDRVQVMYARKNITSIANETYTFLLGKPERFRAQDYADFRTCFFNFAKNAKDEFVRPQLQQEEKVEVKIQDPPLTGEARMQRLKEWEEVVKKSEMVSAVPKMTAKQIIEEGDWRAVPVLEPKSEIEKRIALEESVAKINGARRKMFLAAFPDASEEEIEVYIRQFKTI